MLSGASRGTLAAFFYLSALGAPAQAQPYFIGLAPTTGDYPTTVVGMDSSGSKPVGSVSTPAGERFATWDGYGNNFETATIVTNELSSWCVGVSNDHQFTAGNSNGPDGSLRPFRRSASGALEFLPPINGQAYMTADSISGNGLVIVGTVGSISRERAYRWSGGPVQDLGTLPDTPFNGNVHAYGVSDDGAAAVGDCQRTFLRNNTLVTETHAFVWTESGGMQALGLLPGGTTASANKITPDQRFVVGRSSYVNPNFGFHAVRWDRFTGVVEDLGSPVGFGNSFGLAISAAGATVAGYCQLPGSNDARFACIWTPQTGMIELKSYLASHNVSLTGWTLTFANSVSADGLVIAGKGDLNGQPRGWVVRLGNSPCDADLNRDGNIDMGDVDALINDLPGNNPYGFDPDFNQDGNADQDDIDALINTIAGGGCP
jgi:hypothetical protein